MDSGRTVNIPGSRRPNHTAISFKDQTVTYAQLNRRVDSLAAGLSRAGLKPGDVCVLLMPNSIHWVTVYYALAKVGSVVLPVNFLYRVGELRHIFRDSGARAFIGHTVCLEEAREVMNGLPEMDIRVAVGGPAAGFTPLEALFSDHDTFPAYPAQDDEPLAMIYTSGTTGAPKGAVLTHRNLASNAMTVADMRHPSPEDVVLGVSASVMSTRLSHSTASSSSSDRERGNRVRYSERAGVLDHPEKW